MQDTLGDWSSGDGPLHRRLTTVLTEAIEDGRLVSGTRLPPERTLAQELSVSRSTVATALETLAQHGLVDRRQGSGTYVRTIERPPIEGRHELVSELDQHALLRDLAGRPEAAVELLAAAVDCAPEVHTAVAEVAQDIARWTGGHGYVPMGLPPLREAVADHMTRRGLSTAPEQVLITTGAVEAVLLAARLFVGPGDAVVVEAPSYIGALDVLRSVGGRLLGVDVDERGARTDQIATAFARSSPRMAYLVPDFQNPTGVVLSPPRRKEIARLASEHRIPVVEDLVQHDLWSDAAPPAPIAAQDPEAPILTLGSMSKVFWGGLRIGWVRSDQATIERLARIKTATNYGTPAIDQLVAARLVPLFDEVGARRRSLLALRLATLEDALHAHLPEWRWRSPEGGMSLWTKLPYAVAPALPAVASRCGVAIAAGASFGLAAGDHPDRVRIPFVAEPDVIAEGVRRLAQAWRHLAASPRAGTPRAIVV